MIEFYQTLGSFMSEVSQCACVTWMLRVNFWVSALHTKLSTENQMTPVTVLLYLNTEGTF